MLYEDKSRQEMLEEYIIMLVQNAGAQGVSLGTLGNRIRNRFGDFKVRDYGYSQFKQYIQSFPSIQDVYKRQLQTMPISSVAASIRPFIPSGNA